MTLDELDKLAAEKVMKFVEGNAFWYPDGTEPIGGSVNQGAIHKKHWQPTRNIAQAWELLEKLNKGFDVYGASKSAATRYMARVLDKDDAFEAVAESAPLAITKACLKAVGVELE